MSEFPALKKLNDRLKNKVKTQGYITGLDGRIIKCDKEHVALNYLLQSAGSVIMKKALELVVVAFDVYKNDARFVANVHDEWQLEVKDEDDTPDLVGMMCCQAIKEAGKELGFPCPMEGEYKIGRNWKETH